MTVTVVVAERIAQKGIQLAAHLIGAVVFGAKAEGPLDTRVHVQLTVSQGVECLIGGDAETRGKVAGGTRHRPSASVRVIARIFCMRIVGSSYQVFQYFNCETPVSQLFTVLI